MHCISFATEIYHFELAHNTLPYNPPYFPIDYIRIAQHSIDNNESISIQNNWVSTFLSFRATSKQYISCWYLVSIVFSVASLQYSTWFRLRVYHLQSIPPLFMNCSCCLALCFGFLWSVCFLVTFITISFFTFFGRLQIFALTRAIWWLAECYVQHFWISKMRETREIYNKYSKPTHRTAYKTIEWIWMREMKWYNSKIFCEIDYARELEMNGI